MEQLTDYNVTEPEVWNITSGAELNDTVNVTRIPVSPKGGFRLPPAFYPVIVTAMLTSIVCLLATAFVYRRLPEFRNLPGRNLFSLCVCMTLTYVFLITDIAFGARFIGKRSAGCLVLASLTHVFFLAVFAWTNILAYDIWHTLAGTAKLTDNSNGKERASKRYRRYALYAWTSTALVASPPLVQGWGSLDWSPALPDSRLGDGRCWLNGQRAFLVYFNAPVGVALLVNMVFFVLTARTMIRIRNMTNVMNIRQNRRRFHLYLKLFLVMGFVWLIEFLPLVTGVYFLYAVAGFLTSLYGVALFVIFVCKVRVWKALRKTENLCYCWKRTKGDWNASTRTARLPSRTTVTTSLSNITIDSVRVQNATMP